MTLVHRSISLFLVIFIFFNPSSAFAKDLDEIKRDGYIRHLGVPYAHFITGAGDGLDVEIMQLFAKHLGVEYRYVETSWRKTFGDLTGQHAGYRNGKVQRLDKTDIKGDVIGHGMTVLDWRRELVSFSQEAFPTAVWLIARADSAMQPIVSSKNISDDILSSKNAMTGKSLLAVAGTCADANLYNLDRDLIDIRELDKIANPMQLVPEILGQRAESTLLDAPDVMLALQRYPGQIKVIGPVSPSQTMAFAFRYESPDLKAAFETFFTGIKQDGTYMRLVRKYYPSVFHYFPEFFVGIPE